MNEDRNNIEYSNLVDMLVSKADTHKDKIGFTYLLDGDAEEATLTFAELDHQARLIGTELQRLGVKGERVLLLYAPGLDYISAFFGCLYAGAIAVPTYPPDVTRLERSMPRFLSIVSSSEPKIALTTKPILTMAQFLLAQNPILYDITWVATDRIAANGVKDSEIHGSGWEKPDISSDTIAFLQFTSGSTAEPKGVMLTHGNLLSNLNVICDAFEVNDLDDQAMFWLPFYHDMGLIGGVIAPIYCGAKNVLISPLDFSQKPMRWLRAISKYKSTISGGPNFAFDLCVRKARQRDLDTIDLSSWKVAFNGAEPVRAGTMERFSKKFEGCGFDRRAFFPCYGLAESTLFVSGIFRNEEPLVQKFLIDELSEGIVESIDEEETCSTSNENIRTLVGCGYPRTEHTVEIIDPDTLERCENNQSGNSRIGEIWVSGPSIATGYWKKPQETEYTFNAHINDDAERSYLRTGDLGFISNGQLFVAGRLKDLIILDGLNHYPQDIEFSIESSHPAIRPGCSAAFSIEVNNREKLIVATEIAKPVKLKALCEQGGVELDPKSIRLDIRSAIAKNHDLRVYDIVLLKPGTIPKTSSGKIRRHKCKDRYLASELDIWAG